MWLHLPLWGATLLSWALGTAPVSRHCGFLEYWDFKRGCCRRCLERFGPPTCPDYEFTRHCGLSDRGDLMDFPFARCPPGLCNRDRAEQCSRCLDLPQPPSLPHPNPQQPEPVAPEPSVPWNRCDWENVAIPTKSSSSANPRGPGPSDGPPTSPRPWVPQQPFAGSMAWYVVGITALLVGGLLVSAALQTLLGRAENEEKVAEAGEACKFFPLTEEPVPPTLAHQPLSRLLDELEVLEELVVLLDPEPGPRGGSAWGTTRHLAACYGLPASWATFAYSLRPAHSPLRALLETVTAQNPTAQLGQLADHLSHLGRGDALGVLHKLR
ncbi:IGF-like family receptor 1 [Vombatus ursinus]|uniref:IGF-like family receptor 1 n=1 Tax=Vombatus ursinus TaxID=29139 RepID=A0A4X2LYR2_VOMUR|nr:IGF-like family receptor 1 [Vombatus ursinus]